jgi:hypothetical protein
LHRCMLRPPSKGHRAIMWLSGWCLMVQAVLRDLHACTGADARVVCMGIGQCGCLTVF